MVKLPINKHELKMFKTLTDVKTTGIEQVIHFTEKYIEYTDNYICLQYTPKNNEYTQYIVEQNLNNTVLHHDQIEHFFNENKDCKTFSYITMSKDNFKKIDYYPPINRVIDAIDTTIINNTICLSFDYLEKILTITKALYDKRNITGIDIQINAKHQPVKFHFSKTNRANDLTVYVAPIIQQTLKRESAIDTRN